MRNLPKVYIPIPSISTLLSAIALSFIIFDSTGSWLESINAASSTISFINALGFLANEKLLKDNPKFHYQSQEEQKAQGYKYVDNTYDNYNRDNDFIEKLADEIKENALKQINIEFVD